MWYGVEPGNADGAGTAEAAVEASWLEIWMTRWASPLTRFAYALTGSEEAAQDIAQETFLRLLTERRRARVMAVSPGWLFTVARNLARERWRHAGREAPTDVAPEAPAVDDDPTRRLDVWRTLDLLSATDRECLWLFYYTDLSVNELADELHISPRAVKTRLHRARQNFLRRWGEDVRG